MTVPVVPIALGATAVGLGLAWWLGAFSGAGAATATALGTKDGCARGTAAKQAGQTLAQTAAAVNPGGKDGDAVQAAAAASGNSKAYLAAFAAAVSDCYGKASTTTQDADVKPLPAPPADKPKTPSTPAEWYLDRVQAMNDWFSYSRRGAQEGWNEYLTDYERRDFGTKTAKAAARSCGYARGWTLAKTAKKDVGGLGEVLGGPPTTLPLNVENSIFAECATKFDAWYTAHKNDQLAGPGGTSVSGALVGWMKTTTVGGRALIGERRIFRLQAVDANVVHHSPAMAVQTAGRAPRATDHPLGWPAPPRRTA